MNRRDFISGFARISFLGALGALLAFFAVKGRIAMEGEACTGSQCNACGKITACKLPEAQKFRSHGKE